MARSRLFPLPPTSSCGAVGKQLISVSAIWTFLFETVLFTICFHNGFHNDVGGSGRGRVSESSSERHPATRGKLTEMDQASARASPMAAAQGWPLRRSAQWLRRP